MKKFITAIHLCLMACAAATANDGIYYTAGNQLIPIEETDITIRKEVLTISLGDDGFAHVDVQYELYNPGMTEKRVLMGFEADPSYNDDYKLYPDGKHPHIHDFTVEMNGQPLTYQNAVCQHDLPEGVKPIDMSKYELSEMATTVHPKDNDTLYVPFSYVYYFDASFQPGLNRIHHTYRYKQSLSVGIAFEVTYKLSPALRWANRQIDDFTLVIRADGTAKHFVIDEKNFAAAPWMLTEGMGKQRLTSHYDTVLREFTLRNGAYVWHALDFRPTEELNITSADRLYTFNPEAAFGSFYDRTSSFSLMYSQKDDGTYMNDPQDAALRARIAHNLPYAHRGHVFDDPVLYTYFDKLWWYMPDAHYVDSQSDFTACDRQYLEY